MYTNYDKLTESEKNAYAVDYRGKQPPFFFKLE